MKSFLLLLTMVTVAYAGFMLPVPKKDFEPIAEKWYSSSSLEEEDNDSLQYDLHPHEFELYPKTVHVHEDYGHHDHHYFDDFHEHHPKAIVKYHETPKAVHIDEKPKVSKPKIVHIHEHHHHHHHIMKTLPVSIIKKTVYISHG